RKEARTELRRHLSSRAEEVVLRLSRAGGHDAIEGAEKSDGPNHDPDDQEHEFQAVNRGARGVSLYVLCRGRELGRGRSPGGRGPVWQRRFQTTDSKSVFIEQRIFMAPRGWHGRGAQNRDYGPPRCRQDGGRIAELRTGGEGRLGRGQAPAPDAPQEVPQSASPGYPAARRRADPRGDDGESQPLALQDRETDEGRGPLGRRDICLAGI